MMDNGLHELITNNNPFSEFSIGLKDIWGERFLDEPSLNSHASDVIFQCIQQLQSGKINTVGITLRAEKGIGKSHIISRVRHQIQKDGNALFIYMGDYGNLNDIRSEFLKNLAFSLKNIGSREVTQWQELATDILNDVYNKNHHPRDFVYGLPNKIQADPRFVDHLTDRICTVKTDISNPGIIQAILWTLSPAHATYAINWLAGRNLPQLKSEQMGLPNSNQVDQSNDSFDNICMILGLISEYKSVVICFDRLDSVEVSDTGFTTAQVAAMLGMDLYDSIRRGVLITAVYRGTWEQQIKALPNAEAVVDRVSQNIIDLKPLNSDDVVSLVKRRLVDFYYKHNITPPNEVYPFEESILRDKGKQKASARDILQWCQKNWIKIPLVIPTNLVRSAYEKELNTIDSSEFIDDKGKIARALGFCLESFVGRTIDGVTINAINYNITPKAANANYIDFRIICTENSKDTKIGVAVIQYSAGKGIQAGLNRLVNYEKFDLTRGCFIRSKDIPPTAQAAHKLVKQLLNELGGEWPPVKIEDLKPLIAIRSVFDAREDYDVTEEMIYEFMEEIALAKNNPLLLDILSDPSGVLPTDLLDENEDRIDPESALNQDANENSNGLDIDI
jgi:hypothetical protein